MPVHTFILNGKRVSVDVEDDVRLLWVLRDVLGVDGPKYGCGLGVCQACTSHINGKAFNPCSVPISAIRSIYMITTIEGLPATVGKALHPMQEAWLDLDVAQCGYCQPGQIMAAVALVNEVRAKRRAGLALRALLELGAKTTLANANGETAREVGVRTGHLDVVSVIANEPKKAN